MKSSKPLIERKFRTAIVALEVTVMELMKETTDQQSGLVPCKNRFIAGMAGWSTKQLPVQQKQDMHGMRGQNEKHGQTAEIEHMFQRMHGEARPGTHIHISMVD